MCVNSQSNLCLANRFAGELVGPGPPPSQSPVTICGYQPVTLKNRQNQLLLVVQKYNYGISAVGGTSFGNKDPITFTALSGR